MNALQKIYLFCNQHINWDFGPSVNAQLSSIWHSIGDLLF